MISNEDYDLKVAAYSKQMDALQEQQRELKATAGRYAEVKYWLDAYREHVQSGGKDGYRRCGYDTLSDG